MVAQPVAAIAGLVHQQVIADQQRILHRLRRNLERLHNEGDHEDRDHYRAQQRLQGTDQVGTEGSHDAALGRHDWTGGRCHRNIWRSDRAVWRNEGALWRSNGLV